MVARSELYTPDPPPDGDFYVNAVGLFEGKHGWFGREKDRIYGDAEKNFPMFRLRGIRSLGRLSPVTDDAHMLRPTVDPKSFGFVHSRHAHTLLVARTTELILRNNEMPEAIVQEGIIAALLHDIATPAGGDAIKALDPKNLDEEDHWRDVLNDKAFDFIRTLGLDLDSIDDAIHNKGLVGEVLDIADRIAYTYHDTFFVHGPEFGESNPFLYKTIRIDNKNRIVFTDPMQLETFLKVRAHNHVFLYLHPTNRGADMMVKKLAQPLYSDDGSKTLSPQSLRGMDDVGLFEILGRHYGVFPPELEHHIINLYPRWQYCENEAGMRNWIKHLERQDGVSIIGMEHVPGFNPGGGYLVEDPLTNKVVPYAEYSPFEAGSLVYSAKMAAMPYCLYWYDATEDVTPNKAAQSLF